jgi:hypothetical protein
MESKLKKIFSKEWEFILNVYIDYINNQIRQKIDNNKLLKLLEIGVLFGERLAYYNFNYYIEIGCGFAIPSLTLAKLGQKDVLAFDLDMFILEKAEKIKNKCQLDFKIKCLDFYFNRPDLKKNGIWLAEKPRANNDLYEMESETVKIVKKSRESLAIIPTIKKNSKLEDYIKSCKTREIQFRDIGYKVENRQILDCFPYRWIIAVI